MKKIVYLCASAVMAVAVVSRALAQQSVSPDQMQMAYNAARNQIGVLKYCQEKGYVDASVIEINAKVLALLPPPADPSKGDEAEAIGKKGKVSAMGVEQDLSTAAKAQGQTEQKICQTMGEAVKQAGAALPK